MTYNVFMMTLNPTHSLSASILMVISPGGPRLVGSRVTSFWIGAKDDGGGVDN